MEKEHGKKGFTLIELIIVIAILAILAAILIPNMIGYLDKAKEGTCIANVDTARRNAVSWFGLKQGYEKSPADKSALLDEVMQDSFGGKAQKIRDNVYGGLCPSGGEYVFVYSEAGMPSCSCSVHQQAKKQDVDHIKELWSIQKVKDYFSKKAAGSSLDSTASHAAAIAPDINRVMQQQFGVDPATVSWRIYKVGTNDYIIYWTNTNVGGVNVGERCTVTRYYTKTDTAQTGTAPVQSKTTEGSTYHIIDHQNFIAD